MTRGIYRIGSSEATFYVGQSRDAEKRLRVHRSTLRTGTHPNHYLQAVYNKYPDEFTDYEVIEEIREGPMYEREAIWITTLEARCNLKVPDGDGWTWSQESRERARESHLARWTPEAREEFGRNRRALIESLAPDERKAMLGGARGRVAWNKGITKEEDGLDHWKPGRKPGSIPWNKGKKCPKSPESAKKQAASLRARPLVKCPTCGREFKVLKRHEPHCRGR